jgi:hypothetical protein
MKDTMSVTPRIEMHMKLCGRHGFLMLNRPSHQ